MNGHGWTGKVLRVDLTTGHTTAEDTSRYKPFLGGTGLAYKVLWDEVPPGTKAYDPENRLIFGVGPMTGTGTPSSGRVSVTSLWPMTPGELPGTGHMGGHWGAELKYAGWDSIIVQGKSNIPVWIFIDDGQIQIRDARRIWGSGIYRATAEICAEVGSDVHVTAIGQAGENMVNLACIMCDRSHGAGGLGGVMGAKNLKAIAVRGTGSVKIAADKRAWKALIHRYLELYGANSGAVVPSTPQPWSEYYGGGRWTAQKGLFWGAASPPLELGECPASDLNKLGLRTHKGVLDFSKTDPATGKKIGETITTRMGGCHSCPIRCHIMIDLPSMESKYGLPRYSSNTCSGWQGTQIYPTSTKDPWQETEAKVLGSILADDYGVWNNYGQTGSDFVYAYKNGIIRDNLSEKEYNSIPWDLLEKYDPRFHFDYMRRISYKEGELGEALGEGSYALHKRWKFPQSYFVTEKKNWKMGHPYHHSIEVAGQAGALLQLFFNRDAQNHVHNSYLGCGLPHDLQLEILNEITGLPESMDPVHDYKPITPGKVRFAVLSYVYNELHNSLTMCDYNGVAGAWVSPLRDQRYRGEPDIEARIFSAVTGEKVNLEEYESIGLRNLNLLRALTARYMNEKDQRNKHDMIPEWAFDYPGWRDKQPFTAGHDKLDRADMEVAKDLLYDQMGWTRTTGMPTRNTLEALGLKDVADDLASRGLI